MEESSSSIVSDFLPDKNVIVCDNGAFSLKVGFAKDDSPRVLIPTIFGTPRDSEIEMPDYGRRSRYAGRCVEENQDILNVSFPISKGMITDWDAMEDVWYHMYYDEMMVPPENFSILHTEIIDTSASSREKFVEIMFETFNVPGMALVSSSALALYRVGKTTGVVINSGFDYTKVVPIYEGYPLTHTVKNLSLGGWNVTQYLAQLLSDRYKTNFNFSKKWEVIRDIKQKFCYCALDFEKELAMQSEDDKHTYKLPDGVVIEVSSEAFRSPEILFKPALFNIESEDGGIHDMVYKAVSCCEIEEQIEMYKNIVLAGGNTLFPFLPNRLENMVEKLTPTATEVKTDAPVGHRYSTWIGGSILASSFNFERILIDRVEYEETGPSIAHIKSIF